MYDRFTQDSMEIITLAQDEAESWCHSYVGTEHLLLAFLKQTRGDVYRFLRSQGISYRQVAAIVEQEKGRGTVKLSAKDLDPTAPLKKAMKISYDEARRAGFNTIRPEHLLLGLLHVREGTAASILSQLQVDLKKVQSYFSPPQGVGVPARSGSGPRIKVDLTQFGRNLVEEAIAGRLDPMIGRNEEMERIIQTLSRRRKNNPALIGESGVGKTAIVEGLAQRIASGDVPAVIADKEIFELDMAAVVAGTKYRGEFEQRLKTLLNQIMQVKNIILFIDELPTVVGAGGAEGALDASAIFKPPLAKGAIQCIGTATLDQYRKSIEKDPALRRRFKTIMIEEPSVEDTVKIIKGLLPRYEEHHGVKITDDAVYQAARLSDRYITDQCLPDKAIDLIDETAAKIKLAGTEPPLEVRRLMADLESLNAEEQQAVSEQQYEIAAQLRDQKEELLSQIKILYNSSQEQELIVDGRDIALMVSSWTGIPLGHVQEEESKRMITMEETIHKRLIGQDEAVKAVSRSIRRAYAGIKDPKRPVGAFMFLGPTGVGKTELSKILAKFLFGDEDSLIRVDMSEYMERFSVSRLIGAPPGYVGYEEAGELTEKVRHRPYSVVLFDEIEKAHRDVFNILLQVMEDGVLTDSQGRRVDFSNTVLIMTSNVGSSAITDRTSLGFSDQEVDSQSSYQDMKARVMSEVKKIFRPEFLNRLDDTIVFHQLVKEQVQQIADLLLGDLQDRLREEHNIELILNHAAKDLLIENGYNPKYGARPMRRAIEQMIETPLSDLILKGEFSDGSKISVTVRKGILKFSKGD
ncbi:ATP-dependent Clp protease ATP-binding subunit [Candidatus Acetothermia bacterium]|nr:ATP-dependent Clp protease ATP-binding subunit [Candidatus Acetothermia bacterium]MCI2427076.1 ATP-dependent Clp protease ATP-binding subunit [Candidatus Acetothermia bacterium]MCI2428603.1 ATP-dependent Clp protease ATP-binding subunit [Candidatus Acetothermia bacterium]